MRRRGSRAIRAVCAVLCGVALIAALGVLALHSAPVRALLLARILDSLNDTIRGHLTAEALEVRGTTFAVRGLELRAPSGELVATAARIDGVPLWPLVHRRLVLDGAGMKDVRVSATAAPRGVDLFDAMARVERGDERGGGGLDLRSVSIESGRVTFAQRLVASAAERVDGDVASGWIGRREPGGPVVIAFRGAALSPLGRAYEAEFRLHPRSAGNVRDIVVAAEGLRVDLSLGRAEGAREVRVREVVAAPDAARALWPSWPLRAPAAVRGRVLVRPATVAADVEATIGAGRIRVQGALDRSRAQRHRATAEFWSLDASALGPLPSSTLHGTAEVSGAPGLGESSGSISVRLREESAIGGRRLGPATARVSVADGRVRADVAAVFETRSIAVSGAARVSEGGHHVRLEALVAEIAGARWTLARTATIRSGGGAVAVDRLTLRSGRNVITARGAASGDRLRASLVAGGIDGALVSAAARAAGLRVPAVAGTLVARLRAGGSPSRPIFDLAVSSPRLRLGSLPPAALRARASAGRATTRITVTARTDRARAAAAATIPAGAADLARAVRGDAPGELPFTASGEVRATAAAVAGRRWGIDRGSVELRARAGGTLARPWLDVDARLRGVARAGTPALDGDAHATWRSGALRATARLSARSGGLLEMAGSLREQAGGGERALVLDAAAIARDFDPAPVAGWIPRVESASGKIYGHASVAGPLDALRTSWQLSWANGRLVTTGFGTFGPFRVEGSGDGARATVVFDGASGRGTFTGHAQAVPREDGIDLSGELNVVRLPIVVDSQLRAWATARVALSGLVSGAGLRAHADVREGDVELPEQAGGALQAVARPEGILVVSGSGAHGSRDETARRSRGKAQLASGARARWQLDVVADRPVAVHGGNVRARVVTAPTLRIEWTDRLLAFGALRATSGELQVSGAGVDVVSGTELRFAGPPEPPFLEVASGRDLEPAPPHVQSRRRPADEAPAPRRRLYSMLAEGRAQPPRTSAHSSVEGPGWGSAIDRAFASQVPIGAFLERGTISRATDVQSGVTGQVDLGTVSRLAGDPSQGENRRTIRLGVRLAPRLRLEGSSGDGGVLGMDLMWDLRGDR